MSIAAVDAADGHVLDWAPELGNWSFADTPVATMLVAPSGSPVYLAGQVAIGSPPTGRYGVVALDATSGAPTTFRADIPFPDATSEPFVVGLALVGATLYLGGRFNSVRGEPRRNLAAVHAITGAARPWAPQPDDRVNALTYDDGIIYAAGELLGCERHAPNWDRGVGRCHRPAAFIGP